MRKSTKGAAYRKGADGRRSIGRKEEIAGRTGQAGMPGHTGSTPEFRPNHDKAESRAKEYAPAQMSAEEVKAYIQEKFADEKPNSQISSADTTGIHRL